MNKYTAFRCPENLLEKAKVRARKQNRSLSNYVVRLIELDTAEEPDLEKTAVAAIRR